MKKGLTYEQQYGEERAKEIKNKLSEVGKRPNSGQFKKGIVPWIKGKHHTKESIEKQRKSIKEWYKDPKNADTIKEMQKDQGENRKAFYKKLKDEGKYDDFMKQCGITISKGKKGKKFTDEHKNAISNAHFSKKPQGKKVLKQIGQSLKKRYDSGEIQPWNKGLDKDTDTRIENSIASQPHSEEWNKRVGDALRNSKAHKKYMKSEKHRQDCIKGAVAARITNETIRPNGPESKFIELCEKHDLPYMYVGDGQFWLGHSPRNPDFLNSNGEKTVVEIHGVYWHLLKQQKENPNLTRKMVEAEEHSHYSKYGFKSIILWEDELDNDEFVLNKLV